MRERPSRDLYDGRRIWIKNFRLEVSVFLLPALIPSVIMGLVVSVSLVPCNNFFHDHILENGSCQR